MCSVDGNFREGVAANQNELGAVRHSAPNITAPRMGPLKLASVCA
jgi:hypothetical protein